MNGLVGRWHSDSIQVWSPIQVLVMLSVLDVRVLVWIWLYFILVANGVYQNSIYGIAAYLPSKYTNAVILGSVSESVCNVSQLSDMRY